MPITIKSSTERLVVRQLTGEELTKLGFPDTTSGNRVLFIVLDGNDKAPTGTYWNGLKEHLIDHNLYGLKYQTYAVELLAYQVLIS